MIYDKNVSENRQMLERLARREFADGEEISVIAAPGARVSAWAVKVKSIYSYNFYKVRAVEVGEPGSLPTELGEEMTAVNLAESFSEAGNLSAGKIVVMFRSGDKNVFYAPV